MQVRRVIAVGGLIAVACLLACSRTPMLYPAPSIPVPSPPAAPLREVWLTVEGVGRVSAWYQNSEKSGPALVFLHGNGENLETLRLSGTLQMVAELGVPSLAVDYPGYGLSDGKPSESGLIAAASAAVDWLRDEHPDRKVVPVGWSLGAAVAIQVAVRSQVDGLVILSAWTSLKEIGRVHFPGWMVGLFARESYDSIGVAPQVEVPALVMHGDRDSIIPVMHGRRVAASLPGSRWVEVLGYGHNDLLAAPEVWSELRGFLAGL